MDNDFKSAVLFIVGFFIGMVVMESMYKYSDAFEPYQMDATKIDLVKKGFAQWEINPDGSVFWRLSPPPTTKD